MNITEDQVEVSDASELLAVLHSAFVDTHTVFLRGRTLDDKYILSGTLSRRRQSILAIASTHSDDVILLRGTPPKVMAAKDIAARLAPGLGILFFMGFGRVFRSRFWKQFSHMNTRSLQNRINELRQQGK
jgi:hypothetical protein